MSDTQKTVTGYLGIAFLALAVIFIGMLSIDVANRSILDQTNAEDTVLKPAWRAVAFFMNRDVAQNSVYAGLLTIISISLQYVSENYKGKYQIIAISSLALLGVAGCIIVLTQFSNVNDLRFYGGFKSSSDAVADKLINFFGPIIGWFVSALAGQLGLSAALRDGAVRKLL